MLNYPELYFIIFNPSNQTKIVNIEFKQILGNTNYNQYIQPINLTVNNENKYVSNEYLVISHVFANEGGLFHIDSNKDNLKRYFTGNIEEVKNLKDLQNIKYYKYYITEGVFYTNKNYFFLLVNSLNSQIYMKVTKINIEEKGKELNELNFTYFKISKGNTLSFTNKDNNNVYIIKLVSDNNGTVIINNNEYFFEEQKIEVIQLKTNEIFSITSIDNNYTFAIKLKIPEENIDYGEIGKNYVTSKDKYYKFVIFPINAYDYGTVFYDIDGNKDQWSYEIGFKNIYELEKRETACGVGYLDLYEFNKTEADQTCYLIFFFENITYYNILIKTEYYKSLLIEEDEFVQINGSYMKTSYEDEKARYFIFPYNQFNIQRQQRSYFSSEISNTPLSFYFENDFGTTININTLNEPIYVNYHKFNENEKYYYNTSCKDYFWLDDMNENFLRFNFSNLFSSAPEINYILVICPIDYYRYLHSDYYFFLNFYLNNISSTGEVLVYNFSLKDMIINNNNVSECATNNSIVLPSPDVSFFRKTSTVYMFKVMGVTGPKLKDVNVYTEFYINISPCFNTCLTCDYRGDEQNQSCTSCYNDSLLQEDLGNCVKSCSIGYYQEENFCKKCSSNCETCSNKTDNGNNYCLSCDINSKYKYLLNASNYSSNCVESCPKDTFLDEKNYRCIDKNNNIKYYIIIGVGSILLIIAIIIIIIISKKNKLKKEKEKENIENVPLVPIE